jgi:predicted nucleic acid-binding Zn ribbon protein
MPYVGFEHIIPASKQAKTIHALDRSATVTGEVINRLKILRAMSNRGQTKHPNCSAVMIKIQSLLR